MTASSMRFSLRGGALGLLLLCAPASDPIRGDDIPYAASIALQPNTMRGGGFGEALLGVADLTVTLTAPADYQIVSPPPTAVGGGGALWTPAEGASVPNASYAFQAIGVRRNDDHGAAFHGNLKKLVPGTGQGSGSTNDTFDAAVADLQMQQHKLKSTDQVGIYLAPTVQGSFPATPPASAYGTTFTLNTRWSGNSSQQVGTLSFPNNSTSSGLAVYYNGSLLTSPINVVGGVLNGTLQIVANENFTTATQITGTFTWDSAAGSGSAVDYIFVYPASFWICGVGFSGNGYNAMNKKGSDPYTWDSMTFQDPGDTGMGWIPANGGGNIFQYLTGPAVPTALQDPISVLQNPCTDSSKSPSVTVLAYTNSSVAPNPANVLGHASGAKLTTVISLASAGNGFYIGQGQVVSPIAKTIANTSIGIQWSQTDSNGTTLSVLGSTPFRVFATYAVPNGNQAPVTAKQLDWATKIANTAGTITYAAKLVTKAIDASPGFDLSNNDPSHPWLVLDSKARANCITLCAIARVGLIAVGIPAGISAAFPATQNKYPVSFTLGGQFADNWGNGTTAVYVEIQTVDANPPPGIDYAGLGFIVDGGNNSLEAFITVQDEDYLLNALQVWTVDPPMGPFVYGNLNIDVMSQLDKQLAVTVCWFGLTAAQYNGVVPIDLSTLPVVGNPEPLLDNPTDNNGIPDDAIPQNKGCN